MKARVLHIVVLFLFSSILFSTNTSYAETDISSLVQINNSRMMYDRRTGQYSYNVSLTNTSAELILSPVKVVIDSISSPAVTVANADELTDDDMPYFLYDGDLAPGTTSAARKWLFKNKSRERFSYSTLVRGILQPEVVDRVSAFLRAASGGSIEVTSSESIYSNGVRLEIPPGALPDDMTITIGDVTDNSPPLPAHMVPVGLPISLEPDGLALNKPAKLIIPYSDEELMYANLSSINDITLRTFNTNTLQWSEVPILEIDTVNKLIIAEISHFSLWNPFSWNDNPQDISNSIDDRVLDFVQFVWKIPDTADNIQQALNMNDPASLIPFSSEIGGILVISEMAQRMEREDYTGVIYEGSKWLSKLGLKKLGYQWFGAYVSLAFVTKDLTDYFLKRADEISFNHQIDYYLHYRKPTSEGGWGCSHEQTVNGPCSLLTPSGSGFLLNPDGPQVGFPEFTGKISPEDVYKFGLSVWTAQKAEAYKEENIASIKEAFIKAIQDVKTLNKPVAVISASPDAGSPPLTVAFSAELSTGHIESYKWNFDDNNIDESIAVTNTFYNPGTYNVMLTVYDNLHVGTVTRKKINVTNQNVTNQKPISKFNFIKDMTDPNTVYFDALPSYDPDGHIIKYRWTFGDGTISFDATPTHSFEAEGFYTVSLDVTDDNYQISTFSRTVQIAAITPIISQTPDSGQPGTTFTQWGTGFTPNGTATLHFQKPDGSEYPTKSQTLDSTGHFEVSYTAPLDKPAGTYTWWAIDDTTSTKSNEINYIVTSSPIITQTPMSVSSDAPTITCYGTGFTPNGPMTAYFYTVDDMYAGSLHFNSVSSNGNFGFTWNYSESQASGTYKWFAIDETTGLKSNEISFVFIGKHNIFQRPLSGPPNTAFYQAGIGFTSSGTVTLHFRKPDGTEYPTQTQQSRTWGFFDIWYVAPTSKPPGNYTWWAVDDTTGIKSNEVTYTITAPIIAQTPMSGPPGTTFVQWGTDFALGSVATLHFQKPDGTEYPFSSANIVSVESGHFEVSYTAPLDKPAGTYTWWAVDLLTGMTSNTVSYIIE